MDTGRPAPLRGKSQHSHVAVPSLTALREKLQSQLGRLTLLRHKCEALQLQQRERRNEISKLRAQCIELDGEASRHELSATLLSQVRPHAASPLHAAVWNILHATGFLAFDADTTLPAAPAARGGSHPASDGGQSSAQSRAARHRHADELPLVKDGHLGGATLPSVESDEIYSRLLVPLSTGPQAPSSTAPSIACITAPTALEAFRSFIFHPAFVAFHPQGSVLNVDRWWSAPVDAVLCNSTSWRLAATPTASHSPACKAGASCTSLHPTDVACMHGLQALFDHISSQISSYSAIVDSLCRPSPGRGTGAATAMAMGAPHPHGATSHVLTAASTELDWSHVTPYLTDAEQERLIQAYVALDAASDAQEGVALPVSATAGASAAREGATKLLSILVATASVRRSVGLLPLSQQVQFLMHASKLGKRLLYSAGREEGDGTGIDSSHSTSVDAGESAVPPGSSGQAVGLAAASSHTYMRWPVLACLLGPRNIKKHAETEASLFLCAPVAFALGTWAGAAHGKRSYPLSPVLVHRGPSTSKGSSPPVWSDVCTLVPLVRALTTVHPSLLAATYTRTLGLRAPFAWLRTAVQRVQRRTAGKWRRDVAAGASKRPRLTPTSAAGAIQQGGTAEAKRTLLTGAATHGFMALDSVAVSVQSEEANDDESEGGEEEEDIAEGQASSVSLPVSAAQGYDTMPAPVRAAVHVFGTLPAAVPLPGRRQAVVSADKAARLLRAVGRRQPSAITGDVGNGSATVARVGQDQTRSPVHKPAQTAKNGGSDRYHSTSSTTAAKVEVGAPTGHTSSSSGHAVGAQGQALHRLLCALASTPLSTSSSTSTDVSILGGGDTVLPHVPEDVTPVTLQAFRRLARAIGAHAAHPVIDALHGLQHAADESPSPPAGVLQGLCEAAGPTGVLMRSVLVARADDEHSSSETPAATSTGDTSAAHPGLANVFIAWARYRLTALSVVGPAGLPAHMCHYTPAAMSPALYCALVMQQGKGPVTGGHAVRLHDFLLQCSVQLVRVHVRHGAEAASRATDRQGREHWCAVRLVLAAWHVLEDAGQAACLHASIGGMLQAVHLLAGEALSGCSGEMTAPLAALSSTHALYLAHVAIHYLQQGVLPASERTAASLPGSVACRWAMTSEQPLKAAGQSAATAQRDAITSIVKAVVSHSVGGWATQAAAARVLSLCDPVAYDRPALTASPHGRPRRFLCTPPLQVWVRMQAASLSLEEDLSSLARELTAEFLDSLSSPTPEQAVVAVLQALPALVPLLAAGISPAVGTPSASSAAAVACCSGLLAILGASRSAVGLMQSVEAMQTLVSSAERPSTSASTSLNASVVLPACDAAVEVWATTLLEGSRQHSAQPFASMLGEQEAHVEQNALSLISAPVSALHLQLAVGHGQSRTVVPALTLKRCIAAVRTALHVSTAATLACTDDAAGSRLPQPAFLPAVLAEALCLLQYAGTTLTLLDLHAGRTLTSTSRGFVRQKTWEQGLIDNLLFQAMGTEFGSFGPATSSGAHVYALKSSVEAAAATASSLSAQLAPLVFLAPGITLYEARVQAMLSFCLSADGLTSHAFTVEHDSTAGARKPVRSTAAHPQARGAGTVQPPVMDTVSLVHSSALHPLLQASPPMLSMSESSAQRQGSGSGRPTTHVLSSLTPWRGACPVYLTALHGRCVTALATSGSTSGWDPACAVTQVVDNAFSSGALLPDPFHVAIVRYAARLGDSVAVAVVKSLSDRDTSASLHSHGLPGWSPLGPVLPQLSLCALPTPLIAALAARSAASSADERRAVVAHLLPRCASPEAVAEVWRSHLRATLTESLPIHAAATAGLWLSSQPLSAGAWKLFIGMVTMHTDCCARLSSRHAGSLGSLANPTATPAVANGASSEQGGGGLSSSEAQGVRALLSSVAASHGVMMD